MLSALQEKRRKETGVVGRGGGVEDVQTVITALVKVPDLIDLFEMCVHPILLYGCEIWAFESYGNVCKFAA